MMYCCLGLGGSAKRAGAAILGMALSLSGVAQAADLTETISAGGFKDEPGAMMGDSHATIPAGVMGAGMVGQGQGMVMYMPMYMDMSGTYIGTDKVSTATILSTPNRFVSPPYLR